MFTEFEYFTVFLKNRNFISKVRRSKVTDYAALKTQSVTLARKFLVCLEYVMIQIQLFS